MKRFAFILMAAAALFTACQGEEGGSTGGGKLNIKADFTIAPNPAFTGEEVSFDATASDGIAPYTFNWEIGTEIKLEGQNVKYTFEQNSAYIVKLTVTDKDGNVVYEESEYYTGDDYYVFDFNEDGSGFMITSDEGDMDSTPCTWVLVEGKLTVTVKIGSYSDNMTFALESVSATKAVLVDSEVESDGTSWKEEYVFKKI